MLIERIAAYCTLAVLGALICLPRGSSAARTISIWSDIDGVMTRVVRRFAEILRAQAPAVASPAATDDRIFAARMTIAGILLLAIFPFHRLFFTDALIDEIWHFVDALVAAAGLLGLERFVQIAPDWRDQEYYLWELAAFMWTVFQFGSSHLREIRQLLVAKHLEPITAFVFGGIYLLGTAVVALAGFAILLTAISLLVLIFEVLVVGALTFMEMVLARMYFVGGDSEQGNTGLQCVLFIEMPALLAFFLAALFVGLLEGFTAYSSRWSHAFASGASALNLVLANAGLLMIRTMRHPGEEVATLVKR